LQGIEQEIFESFFEKLNADKEFPSEVVQELRKLWESEEITSEQRILEAIEEGVENGSKSQGN